MAINTPYVLAGIAASGASGAELCWFADTATTLPTDATSALSTTAASEVQTVTMTGTPTGGTFTLSFQGQTTAPLAYNIAAAAMQTALQGLTTIGSGNATVTGTGPWVVTFSGTLANQGVDLLVANGAGLTGGTSPTVAAARTTPGKTGWKSPGLISEDGAAQDVKENSKEIRAYGLATPVRKIVTSSDITMKTTMLETNPVSAAIYHRMALGGISVVGGAFTTTEGTFRSRRYAFVVDAVDGLNKIRMVCPDVEVTDRDGKQIKNGEVIQYGVTLTAYPDSGGNSAYTYHLVSGLT
jgi:hypothetical protein